MSAHQYLRSATADDHAAVDALFARFDLAARAGYTAFLIAHARIVPAVEAALHGCAGPPPLRPRTPNLVADLADMGQAPPALLPVAFPQSEAAAWGMAYVIEGSRLGGGMLARSVGADLPRRYLADVHQQGEWRRFSHALDAALAREDSQPEAAAAARQMFAFYAAAAQAA